MLSSRVFIYSLSSQWHRVALVAGASILGIVMILQTTRIAVADHLGKSANFKKVSRAAQLDPANPNYLYRQALLREFDWEHMDLTEAVRDLKAATTLQPNRPDYWSSLGRACFTVGDDFCADKAYETSVQLAPGNPQYQWSVANYYLLTGRQKESLSHFHRFMELNPDDPTPAFNVCLRGIKDPELIWGSLLADADSKLRLSYVSFLNQNGHAEAAFQFWNRIVLDGSKLPYSAVQPYLDELISSNHVEQAFKMWHDLEKRGEVQTPNIKEPSNSIFNGGFEQEPLNSGFDWRFGAQEYVALDFASKDCYEDKHCLRVDFTVPNNAEYEPIYQIVPVQTNQQYALTADVRSAEISSDSGPRLRVVDPECQTCLSQESQASIGTTSWHQISNTFSTGPTTKAVRVSVWRPRGRAFPMEIQGHFWITSVSLRATSIAASSSPEPNLR